MTDDWIYEKADENIYELTENESYSELQNNKGTAASSTVASSTTGYSPSNQSKCFHVILVLAILLNFLLIIGVGAALVYYQTKMASEIAEISQEINQGLTSGLFDGSTSDGPPGPQGTLCILSQPLYPW